MNQVVWEIFWKFFRRSCGLPTRSIGPTDRSAGLLVGRTHFSGTAVSLVGGDPGVPMSHTIGLLSQNSSNYTWVSRNIKPERNTTLRCLKNRRRIQITLNLIKSLLLFVGV
jgi:hypothetical protein